jgi:hypothetical protein
MLVLLYVSSFFKQKGDNTKSEFVARQNEEKSVLKRRQNSESTQNQSTKNSAESCADENSINNLVGKHINAHVNQGSTKCENELKDVNYSSTNIEKSYNRNENESFRTIKKEISENRQSIILLGKELINTCNTISAQANTLDTIVSEVLNLANMIKSILKTCFTIFLS